MFLYHKHTAVQLFEIVARSNLLYHYENTPMQLTDIFLALKIKQKIS